LSGSVLGGLARKPRREHLGSGQFEKLTHYQHLVLVDKGVSIMGLVELPLGPILSRRTPHLSHFLAHEGEFKHGS